MVFVGLYLKGLHTYFCSIDCERLSTSLSSMKALSSARENAWAMVLSSNSNGQQGRGDDMQWPATAQEQENSNAIGIVKQWQNTGYR
jgi:hypothetical protein